MLLLRLTTLTNCGLTYGCLNCLLEREVFSTTKGDSPYDISSVSIVEEYRNLKRKFGDLVRGTRDQVVTKRIGVQEIVDIIFDLPGVGGGCDRNYFISHADDLRGSKSVSAVFDRIRQHWDYLHPEIYSLLIRELQLARLSLVVEDYQTALDNFLEHTPLAEFCSIEEIRQEAEGDPPKGFTQCVTKHEWEPPPKNLRHIEKLRRRFASCCNLQSFAVTVVGIQRGCTSVTFLVPESAKLNIASDSEFIEDHGITRITFKGNTVYTQVSCASFFKAESVTWLVVLFRMFQRGVAL